MSKVNSCLKVCRKVNQADIKGGQTGCAFFFGGGGILTNILAGEQFASTLCSNVSLLDLETKLPGLCYLKSL